MHKISVALALLSVSAATAFAQAPQQRGGTPAEQAACSRDVSRFCRKMMDQSDFTVLACLKEHRDKLSRSCNEVLVSHGQ